MAEIHSAGDPALATNGAGIAPPDIVVSPPARVPNSLILSPVMPGVATGLPIVDVPPLIEPMGFDDPPAEVYPPPADRRPMRRRFLPPVSNPASGAQVEALPMRAMRPRGPTRAPHVPLPAEPAERLVRLAEASATRSRQVAAATPAPTQPRHWRRPVLVGAGVAAALAVAVALEVGVSVDWLTRLPGAVLHRLAASPAMPSPAELPTDPARRVGYYADRAKAGDADAQVALAVLYARGDGVAQDYAVAANWFRRAAEKGVMRAQYDLGVLYERGRGVPRDPAQAVAWYRKAAEQNHPLAQYNLAVAFTKGEGIRRDPFEAAVWYHRAAAQGVVAAMVNLAILYERGEGVDSSTADAYAWYRAAARRGSVPAARRADELLPAFSPWDQTRAEAKMADIAASIHDAIGERARLAARGAPAATSTAASAAPSAPGGPTLKSGIESESK